MKAIPLIAVAVAVTVLSSCNTTIGLSRDMRILGENMEKQAHKTRGVQTNEDPAVAPVY